MPEHEKYIVLRMKREGCANGLPFEAFLVGNDHDLKEDVCNFTIIEGDLVYEVTKKMIVRRITPPLEIVQEDA